MAAFELDAQLAISGMNSIGYLLQCRLQARAVCTRDKDAGGLGLRLAIAERLVEPAAQVSLEKVFSIHCRDPG